MAHNRTVLQSLSVLTAVACSDCPEEAALAEETLAYCLAEMRQLRDQARDRILARQEVSDLRFWLLADGERGTSHLLE